jgi:hypothetical protein
MKESPMNAELDRETVREKYFSHISVNRPPVVFVQKIEEILDEIYIEAARSSIMDPAWEGPECLLQSCAWTGWGEYRSSDTFARQVMKLDTSQTMLKEMVARQTYDEMHHFFLYRDCIQKMSSKDLCEMPKPPALFAMFDLYDTISDDVVEAIFADQFCSEKGAVHLFTAQLEKGRRMSPEYTETIQKILPDEYFHASIGRTAARILACRGEAERQRMLDLASTMLAQTFKSYQEAGEWGSLATHIV